VAEPSKEGYGSETRGCFANDEDDDDNNKRSIPNRMISRARYRLEFERCSARISAGTPVIILTVLSWFYSVVTENAGILPRLGHNSFLPNPFQFIIQLSSFDAK
jgi:hypothetical protein